MAYNRAIRDEAQQKFPYNVTCRTSHQLAFAVTGKHFTTRIAGNLKMTDIARALNSKNWRLAGNALFTLNHFMSSADEQIMAMHTPDEEELSGAELAQTLAAAQQVWLMMTAAGAISPSRMTPISSFTSSADRTCHPVIPPFFLMKLRMLT
ncbi:hypothetical protein AAQ05_005598, partial [Salmonella enterica subsp. diarizonae]|nr:hypothetical protein [Salmonella enterica subsp. diarizonae]